MRLAENHSYLKVPHENSFRANISQKYLKENKAFRKTEQCKISL